MTYARWGRVVLWQDEYSSEGKHFVVVAIGPKPGVSFFAVRRELDDTTPVGIRAHAACARVELVRILRELADKISGGTIES